MTDVQTPHSLGAVSIRVGAGQRTTLRVLCGDVPPCVTCVSLFVCMPMNEARPSDSLGGL
jgi:hypothetical protein